MNKTFKLHDLTEELHPKQTSGVLSSFAKPLSIVRGDPSEPVTLAKSEKAPERRD